MLPTGEFFFEAIAQSVRQPLSDARHSTTEDDHLGVVQQHGGRETPCECVGVLRQKLVVRKQFGRRLSVILLEPVTATKPLEATGSTAFTHPWVVRDPDVSELARIVGSSTKYRSIGDDAGPDAGGHRDIHEVVRFVFTDGVFRERTYVSIVVNGHWEIELLSGPKLKVESLPARHVYGTFHHGSLKINRATETNPDRAYLEPRIIRVPRIERLDVPQILQRTLRRPRFKNLDPVIACDGHSAFGSANVNCESHRVIHKVPSVTCTESHCKPEPAEFRNSASEGVMFAMQSFFSRFV